MLIFISGSQSQQVETTTNIVQLCFEKIFFYLYLFMISYLFINCHIQIDQQPFACIFKKKTVNDIVVRLLAGYKMCGVCSTE